MTLLTLLSLTLLIGVCCLYCISCVLSAFNKRKWWWWWWWWWWDGHADRQTSSDNIARAVHTRRAGKTLQMLYFTFTLVLLKLHISLSYMHWKRLVRVYMATRCQQVSGRTVKERLLNDLTDDYEPAIDPGVVDLQLSVYLMCSWIDDDSGFVFSHGWESYVSARTRLELCHT